MTPPETTNYMILGYAVVVILLAAVIGYLVLKARTLRSELEMLEKEEQEQKQLDQRREPGQEPVSAEPSAALNSIPRHP